MGTSRAETSATTTSTGPGVARTGSAWRQPARASRKAAARSAARGAAEDGGRGNGSLRGIKYLTISHSRKLLGTAPAEAESTLGGLSKIENVFRALLSYRRGGGWGPGQPARGLPA